MNQYKIANGQAAIEARVILERSIEQGRVAGARVIEAVHTSVPVDAVVRGSAFNFLHAYGNTTEDAKLVVRFGDIGAEQPMHRHALGQVSDRAGIPAQYIRELSESKDDWQRDLSERILNDHFHIGMQNERLLTRTVKGEVRGVLSDRYRRLDSRPLLDIFASECQGLGAVPVGGVITDLRVSLKAILPHVFEPTPGEIVAIGIEFFNSDFGAGKFGLRPYILRVRCLNGAVAEDVFSQVHLGGRLADDIRYSDRTYQLDTKTTASATKDIVRGVLSAEKINARIDSIQQAAERGIDWAKLRGKLAKTLLKGELEAVKDAFEGPDVYNLPAGQSDWRASNAVSWIAHKVEDADRKIELERVAGALLAA